MKPARQELDYAFRRYLEREHALTVSSNATDYRATSKEELDQLAAKAEHDFERGCHLIDSMTAEEQAQCKTVFALMNPNISSFNHNDMIWFFLKNQDDDYRSPHGDRMRSVDFVGPRWLQAYITFGALRSTFQPNARTLPIVTGRKLSEPRPTAA